MPPAICTMHPILTAAIMSGLAIAMLPTFRSRNGLASQAGECCKSPPNRSTNGLSGTSFTTNPFLESNSYGACVIFGLCCSEQAE